MCARLEVHLKLSVVVSSPFTWSVEIIFFCPTWLASPKLEVILRVIQMMWWITPFWGLCHDITVTNICLSFSWPILHSKDGFKKNNFAILSSPPMRTTTYVPMAHRFQSLISRYTCILSPYVAVSTKMRKKHHTFLGLRDLLAAV